MSLFCKPTVYECVFAAVCASGVDLCPFTYCPKHPAVTEVCLVEKQLDTHFGTVYLLNIYAYTINKTFGFSKIFQIKNMLLYSKKY